MDPPPWLYLSTYDLFEVNFTNFIPFFLISLSLTQSISQIDPSKDLVTQALLYQGIGLLIVLICHFVRLK